MLNLHVVAYKPTPSYKHQQRNIVSSTNRINKLHITAYVLFDYRRYSETQHPTHPHIVHNLLISFYLNFTQVRLHIQHHITSKPYHVHATECVTTRYTAAKLLTRTFLITTLVLLFYPATYQRHPTHSQTSTLTLLLTRLLHDIPYDSLTHPLTYWISRHQLIFNCAENTLFQRL